MTSRNVCCPKIGIIALEDVLIERIEPAAGTIRVVISDRVPLAISIPRGVADAPPVLDRNEMVGFLEFRGHDPRRAGEPDRWVHRNTGTARPSETGMSESAAGGFASIGRPSKLGRVGCELRASCALAGATVHRPANTRPISRNQCSFRFAADRLIPRDPRHVCLPTEFLRATIDMWTIDHSVAIAYLVSTGLPFGEVRFRISFRNRQLSDRKIEGSTDYAQKNDDADYMSGSGKMVILREAVVVD